MVICHMKTYTGLFTATENAKNATETLLLVLPSFIYMLVAVLLSPFLAAQYRLVAFFIEFVIIVVPIILNVTVLSNYVTNMVVIICVLLGMHLLLYVVYMCCKYKKDIRTKKTSDPKKKDYITNCRATINLISVIAILAVDFNVFPSRFSKTSRTGFSLMDVGVGLYVFANGIVAPEVRGKKDTIKNSIIGSTLLLIIGILRLILTKITHYRVSDKEYGVHWNFFITLAFTKIFCSCILNIVKLKYVIFNAVLITVAHETLLQLSLKEWVFSSDERANFIEANKEGLVSTTGYVALYLYSLYFSHRIKQSEKSLMHTNIEFISITLWTLTMTIFCSNYFEVSRRLANAGYIFWVLYLGFFMTWLFFLAENGVNILFRGKIPNYVCSPFLYEAVNYNGLIFFLIGNVLTGLINLFTNTRHVNSVYALLILILYMFINCSIVFTFYIKQWKLKV